MIFMYAIGATVFVLLFSVGLALYKQREIKLDLISRESTEDKEFFALRIEREDFLFLKDEEKVTFIQSLDDVDDFKMKDLSGALKQKTTQSSGEKLVMPNTEKKAS